MDTTITLLRESRKASDAELLTLECEENRQYNSRIKELRKLSDQTNQYIETIGRNLHIITGHKHAISKVVNESKQLDGLPISNKYHKQTLDFLNDAIAFMNNAKNVYTKPDSENNLQNNGFKLTSSVQSCAQSSSDVYKATQSSIDKLETLMENMHVIIEMDNDNEQDLERTIFDE
ncbi:uncharacterized protein [Venturia canescens]|uniref:uncharacterized protein isoform X2 n=1 Tax=Venturia canescens TaxID=32260 RepID=UPI001C9C9C5F|nr:uncharacterized protein LOC122414122 isoform X2 [Venturia canescens]XP_043280941.1 uncharacterized protein LOC122414122 isoform X2 [Venturia canescens]